MIEIQLLVPGRPAQTRRIESGHHTVGRSMRADIRLAHPSVARRHALLSIDGSDVSIRTLPGAAPLLRKCGGPLTQATVHSGDVFLIGKCELKVVVGMTMAIAARPGQRKQKEPYVRARPMRCARSSPEAINQMAASQAARPCSPPQEPHVRMVGLQTADGRTIARRVRMERSVDSRPTAWLRSRSLSSDEGLLRRCRLGIHTMGMKQPVDVLFLNHQLRILALTPALPPWRMRIAPLGTRSVLQLPAGRIAATALQVGAYICLASERECAAAGNRKPCARGALFSLRLPLSTGSAVERHPS